MTWPPTFCPDLLSKSLILKSPVLPRKHPLGSNLNKKHKCLHISPGISETQAGHG